jgi:hypothetical protein
VHKVELYERIRRDKACYNWSVRHLSKVVLARFVRNRHLADATYLWAFCSLPHSAGARRYYDTRRANGANHHQSLRALGNRLVGLLHGCLRYRHNYS